MDVITKNIKDLKPYANNPRVNDDAVQYVAESIAQFGFKVPIVIDKDNIIICGHTRYKASVKLGIRDIPCIIADDLTEEQIKAFRLTDNKVSEQAKWDDLLLNIELGDILDIDMSDFGFDLDFDVGDDEPQEEEEPENERLRTNDYYNLDYCDLGRVSGKYQMPTLEPIDYFPSDLIGFNYLLTSNEYDKGIHFFIDDYQFERLWSYPEKYIDKLLQFDCMLTPDFSLYSDMPIAMKIWNTFRSRLIGQIMQDRGIVVIPTISWSEPSTYDFCFDGIPQNSTIAISTVGVMNNDECYKIFCEGTTEMIKRLKPKKIICYGNKPDYDFGDIEVRYYAGFTSKFKESGN